MIVSKRLKYAKKGNDELTFSPCFQVDPNVPLRDVPTTGEEYLLKVVTERKNCPIITKFNADVSKFIANQNRFAEEPPSLKPAPEVLKPTLNWQNEQIADFSKIRMCISRLQNNKSCWPPIKAPIKFKTAEVHVWKQLFDSQAPTLSCIFGLTDSQLVTGMKIIVDHILTQIPAGESIDRSTGRWIYAILACLKLPLLRDTCCLLRDLARTCAEIRSNIDIENENAELAAAPSNLFICLVSRYFNQVDLAE